METFEQKSSFIKRLRNLMAIIMVVFGLGIFGTYLSGQEFLKGLQKINSANRILNLTSLVLEGINSTEQSIEKTYTAQEYRNIRYTFRANMNLVKDHLQEALVHSQKNNEISGQLNEALARVDDYQVKMEEFFRVIIYHPDPKPLYLVESLKEDILEANQFALDAKEILRRIQILLKESSESQFSSLYQNRLRPIVWVAVPLLLLFAFVLIIGSWNTRRIARSIANLKLATDEIAKGNLDYKAEIIERDEIGGVTHEFNNMVASVKEGQQKLRLTMERITRLQSITSAFSSALTSNEVYDVIFTEAFSAVSASAGAVVNLSPDKKFAEIKRLTGYKTDGHKDVMSFSIDAPFHVTWSLRHGEPLFMEDIKEIEERFPIPYAVFIKEGVKSSAVVPLIIGSEAVGVLVFNFTSTKIFDVQEKEFLIALSAQCSQALHRAQLYEEARKAIEVRDEFLSIASHELRTPLTPLKLQFQGLARQVRKHDGANLSYDKILKIVESSDKQVNRLANLIDDLLDVSRISSGRLTLSPEAFNLAEMVEEVVSNYSHQFKAADSVVSFGDLQPVVGYFDKVRIEQVLINLLTNASKYAPGKPIHIDLTEKNNIVRLVVRDEGPGIAKENHTRIFDRFERVRDRDNVGGLGLGLYISKQIVEAHKGKIKVESELHQGSSFIVELPLYSSEPRILS